MLYGLISYINDVHSNKIYIYEVLTMEIYDAFYRNTAMGEKLNVEKNFIQHTNIVHFSLTATSTCRIRNHWTIDIQPVRVEWAVGYIGRAKC